MASLRKRERLMLKNSPMRIQLKVDSTRNELERVDDKLADSKVHSDRGLFPHPTTTTTIIGVIHRFLTACATVGRQPKKKTRITHPHKLERGFLSQSEGTTLSEQNGGYCCFRRWLFRKVDSNSAKNK